MSTAETDGLPTRHRNWVMACVLMGFALTNLDSAIANIASPTLAREFATDEAATVWVVNIYQLAMAICLLPAAALGGKLGIKQIYGAGLALFTAASVCCALAPSLTSLVGARLVQGIGGACVSGLAPALIRIIYPRRLTGQGFALAALVIAVSGVAGPTIAALLLSVASWPWLFLVNVPVCLVALPLFLGIAPATPGRSQPFDIPGALLSAIALGLLVTGVGGLSGRHADIAWGEIVGGAAVLIWFIKGQQGQEAPLLPLDLMRVPLFTLSLGTSICSYCAQILAYVSLPFLFQDVLQRSALATGLLVTPWPLFVAFVSPIAGRLAARYPTFLLSGIGMGIMTAGLVFLIALPEAPADWDIIWRMAICGAGFGCFQTPNNTTLMTAGPVARNAAASAMVGLARLIGWTLGSALVALLLGAQGKSGAVTCLIAAAVVAASGLLISGSQWLPTRRAL